MKKWMVSAVAALLLGTAGFCYAGGVGATIGLIDQRLTQLGVLVGGVYTPATSVTVTISPIVAGVGAPDVIVADGRQVTNTGTTVKAAGTLPAATVGAHVFFSNVDTDGIRINAAGDDVIRLGDITSAAAGYVESVRVGSTLHLVAVSTSSWVCDSPSGTWRADSTTSAGFAFTPQGPTAYTLSHSWDADVDVTENAATTFYTQVGSMLTWWGEIRFTGAPPNTTLAIKLPNSWSWQTNHDVASNGWAIVSDVTVYDNGVGALGHCRLQLTLSDRTTVTLMSGTTTLANSSATSPITWATGDAVWFRCTVPVQ